MFPFNWRYLRDCILHFIYPKLCLGCGKPLISAEELICLNCFIGLPFTHYHHIADNETALRLKGRISFVHATSLAYFSKDSLLQYLLQDLKYKGNIALGQFLGKQFAFALKKTTWIQTIDFILAVPLHTKKEQSRGYNQSDIIAKELAKELGIKLAEKVLLRVRDTETQTHKSRQERHENMEQAFALSECTLLENKHVLLLDDVLTTGATIESCVLTLQQIPGIQVSIASIGIAI